MEFIGLFPLICIAGVLCWLFFTAGQYSKENPSEEVMMQRLIQSRLGRKMAKITRDDLEREIEAASSNLAHRQA